MGSAAPDDGRTEDGVFLRRAIEASVRIGIVALLVVWCFAILRPFLQPLAWAIVLAIALHTPFEHLQYVLGGRRRLAAALLVLGALLVLLAPTAALTSSLVDTAVGLAGELREGKIEIPPPPERVAAVPVVGEILYARWTLASQNLEQVLADFTPQLRAVGRWLVSALATAGGGIVKFVLSLLIAGVLLARSERSAAGVTAVAIRLGGARGAELARLSAATVQSVTRGILGVAVIQSLLAGIGMLAAGVPGAGLWALLVLLLAVIQLPTVLVLLPVALYVFSTTSLAPAIAFAVWSLFVGLIDNVLKPMLLGRGLDIPMVVIFLGAIGGFLLEGIIGLFVGAVVLAVGYRLLLAWLAESSGAAAPSPAARPETIPRRDEPHSPVE